MSARGYLSASTTRPCHCTPPPYALTYLCGCASEAEAQTLRILAETEPASVWWHVYTQQDSLRQRAAERAPLAQKALPALAIALEQFIALEV